MKCSEKHHAEWQHFAQEAYFILGREIITVKYLTAFQIFLFQLITCGKELEELINFLRGWTGT